MSKWVCNLTWEDAPHLSEQDKKELLSAYLPHERDARSKGIPQLGAGAIYPVVEDDVIIEPFRIPDKWLRAYALDVGWKKTAALWGAYEEASDTWYIYSEYYRGYAEPAVHADAIKARGTWIAGVIDPNSDRRSESGGEALLSMYERFGLNLSKANNAVEPGLLEVYQRLSSGRIRFFSHLLNVRAEFRVYRRDLNGKIVKKNDHLMDCLRYLIMSGQQVADIPPLEESDTNTQFKNNQGRSSICGY